MALQTCPVIPPTASPKIHQILQGIVHRDIKPENLLVAADGSIRLADFGLAIDTSQETPKARVGTLDYFAPEVDIPSDLNISTNLSQVS